VVPRASSRLVAFAWRHRAWAALAGLLLVFVTGALVDLLRVRAEVDEGRRALAGLSAEHLNRELLPRVDAAADHLTRADRIADRSPFLSLLGAVPGVGGQVDGLRTLTEAAEDLGDSARQAAVAIDPDVQRAGREPRARLRLIDRLATELRRVEADAAAIDLGPALRGPLGTARAELRAELDRLPARIDEAQTRLAALERVLRGPTRYLVLAGNNAEMRGGSGMPLSGGVLTIEDGDLEFGDFVPTANRWAGPIDRSLVPDEYQRTYRQFRMGQSWLQTAVSPNYPVIGPVYDAMSSEFPRFGPVDGVIVVDTVTLRHLLQVIGPVEVDGTRYTAATVERQLLNESYLRVGRESADRVARQDQQGLVATAIFDALKARDVDLASLSSAMRRSAAGRHLLAFAEDRTVQEMFTELGAAGALHPDGLMVTVQNIAADKLDWYIDPAVSIRSTQERSTGIWRVRLTVTIPNPTREGDTAGVESYKPDYEPGVHRAMVAVYLPRAAFDIRAVGGEVTEAGADPPMWMVAQRVFIEEGDERAVTFGFALPPERGGFLLLPSARVRPVSYTIDGVATDDAVRRAIGFRRPSTDEGRWASGSAAALAVLGAALLVVSARRREVGAAARPLPAASARDDRMRAVGLLLYLAAGLLLVAAGLIDGLG
jgi:hypothetical protein